MGPGQREPLTDTPGEPLLLRGKEGKLYSAGGAVGIRAVGGLVGRVDVVVSVGGVDHEVEVLLRQLALLLLV